MTDVTSSKSQASQTESNLPPPWEREWNNLTAGLKKLGSDMKQTLTEPFTPPPGMPPPWERMWGSFDPPAKPKVVKQAKVSTTEGGWDQINAQYAAGQKERDRERLNLLQYEYDNEKNPKLKQIRKRELERALRAS